jgi:hypothetical protein
MEEKQDERRKRFFPSVSLGNILAAIAFIASGVGVYTQVIADVNTSKTEIANLKQNEIKRESVEKESRQEIRAELRDVKLDVKELNQKIDKVLQEVIKQRTR